MIRSSAHSRMQVQKSKWRWDEMLVLAATLLALGLRLYMVEHYRLWQDELFEAAQHISQPVWYNLQNYRLDSQFLHVLTAKFMALFGWDPLLLRWPAVVAGVVAIPLIYRIGRRLFDRRVGVVTAIMLSFTFAHVDLSWQIRGYTLMLTLVWLGLYCFVRGLDRPQYRWWLGTALAFGLAAHTHLFALFALPPVCLFLGLSLKFWQEDSNRQPTRGQFIHPILVAGGALLVLLVSIPLLVMQNQQTVAHLSQILNNDWTSDFAPINFQNPANTLVSYLNLNFYLNPLPVRGWPGLIFAGLITLGVVAALQQPEFRRSIVLLALVLLLPPLSMTLLVTVLGPWFYVFHRHVIYILPAYLLLTGLSLWSIARWGADLVRPGRFSASTIQSGFVAVILVILLISTLSRVSDRAGLQQRPNQVGRYIHRNYAVGDLIVCVSSEPTRVKGNRRDLCTITMHFFPNLAAKTFLFDEITQYRTLETFLRPDRDCISHYVHHPHPGTQLTCDAIAPDRARPVPGIWLVMWRDQMPDSPLPDSVEAESAARVWFGPTEVLYLNRQATLLDGLIEAAKIALTQANTPQRAYLNSISLANLYAAQRNLDQARAVLDEAEAKNKLPGRQFEAPTIAYRVEANFGNQMMLLGYDFPSRRVQPGAGLPITLYWQALQLMDQEYLVFNHLLDTKLNSWGGYDRLPRDEYSTLFWRSGEVIRDEYTVPVDAHAPDGVYRLDIGVYRPQGDQAISLPLVQNGQAIDATSVVISPIKVGGPPPGVTFATAIPQTPVNITLGDQISLLGFDLSRDQPGEATRLLGAAPLRLTLYWRALAVPITDYTVFVHIRNSTGETVAQKDSPPVGGAYPTSLWDAGEIIKDEITIPLESVEPGKYEVAVGMYELATGTRLPIAGSPDGTILLSALEISQ